MRARNTHMYTVVLRRAQFVGRQNGHLEGSAQSAPVRPRARLPAAALSLPHVSCALSGGEALLNQVKAYKSHTKHLHTYRSEPFNRSRRTGVFETV